MTPLTPILKRRIAANGPMTLADFMSECLLHPEHGYYTTRDPLGTTGDFTTAPEISQMFGELIGLCLAQSWLDQGQPDFTLAELGPGRGTLMADILRSTQTIPGFADAASVHLVEASPTLRARQKDLLIDHSITWHDSISGLPEAPLFLVANEFFDALPIRQFLRDPNGWRERVVGLTEGRLSFGLSSPAPVSALDHRLTDTAPKDVVEICPQAPGIVQQIAQRIATHGGAALIVDYGGWHSLGDTFQALESHKTVDPLSRPGAADLTAHVDFEALAKAAAPAISSAMVTQGIFLERLGITARAQNLAKHLSGAALESHIAAHRRLTHPDEMGTLFKVLGLTPPGAPPLAGLDT